MTSDDIVLLYKDGTMTSELENIKELYGNYPIYARSYTDDLYVFVWDYNNKSYLPSIICNNVKEIFVRSNSWLPLINANNDLYFYNTAKYTTDFAMKNVKDVFCVDGRYAVISNDNVLYDIDIEYNYHKKQYDYKSTLIEKNVKELICVIGRRYFVNSSNDELYTGFYGGGANVKLNAIKTGIYDYRLTGIYPIRVLKKIKNWKLDIIHSHTEFGVGTFARIIAKQYNIPFILISS